MDTEGRTGPLVAALAEGVRQDLAEIALGLEAVRSAVETLGEVSRAINGLAGECASWRNLLESILTGVRDEMESVPAKLLGAKTPIYTTVDTELAERVRAAKAVA